MKLYKFEKITDQRINTIKRGKIWAASPNSFNDLSDCNFSVQRQNFDKEELERIFFALEKMYPENLKLSNFQKSLLDEIKASIFPPKNPRHSLSEYFDATIARRNIPEIIGKYIKIACFFSAEPTSQLMWAHYGENHNSFCVEYTSTSAPKHYILQINYTTARPSPSLSELLFCPNETINRLVTTKDVEWSYEKETRLIYIDEKTDPISRPSGLEVDIQETLRPTRVIAGYRLYRDQSNLQKFDKVLELAEHLKVDLWCTKFNGDKLGIEKMRDFTT